MSQGSKLMPNLDQQSTKLLNLTVLQRMDAFIEEILITAAHVTFYEFNIDSSQWSRKDVEGSLFVVKRNAQPRFQFIVMNRRNADNLVENLLGDFEFEIQAPYLLYRNETQEVNGIWFYNARECEEVASLFNRILNAYVKVPQLSKAASIKSEFEELEAVPTMAVMDGPLEPSESPLNNVADLPDDPAFVNFFSSALNIGNAPPISAAMNGQPFQSSATLVAPPHRPPLMASLVAAPPNLQMPSPLLSASTPPRTPFHDTTTEAAPNTNNIIKNLVKPSFFAPPPPSSNPMAAAIRVSYSTSSMPAAPQPRHHPPLSLQRPYGAPILQSFPPPTPPPSLTPTALPAPNYGPVISRDKVRDALLVLVQRSQSRLSNSAPTMHVPLVTGTSPKKLTTSVQDNQFIDMVYRAVLNAHNS